MPPRPHLKVDLSPAQLVVTAFVLLILAGTALLRLPFAVDGPGHPGVEDALFMATSASTVTGLASVDISVFSLFGELVLLALIQIGGFGIMTIGSVLALVASRRVGLRQRMLAQAEIGAIDIGELKVLILAIARITVAVEGSVAIVLFVRFWQDGDTPGRAAYSGIFHAVSAFNNAGISLNSDSLVGFVGDPVVVIAASLGFIIGGLGFPVILELWRRQQTALRRRRGQPARALPWSLHIKVTLAATALLLIIGPLVVMIFEWRNPATLGPLDVGDSLLAGWFQGVSPRTAGFNTIDIGGLHEPTQFVITSLMFIGAGPASTSGGIKVTTFALIGFVIWSEVRGDADTNVFGRRLPTALIRQALVIATLSIGLVVGTALTLMALEDLSLSPALFESASAFGTVGLSTGITTSLGTLSHILLVLVMLAGRVGPVTLVTALAFRERVRVYRFPEERPIIG